MEMGTLLLGVAVGALVAGPLALLLMRGKGGDVASEREARERAEAGRIDLETKLREESAERAKATETARSATERLLVAEADRARLGTLERERDVALDRAEAAKAQGESLLRGLREAHEAEREGHARELATRDLAIKTLDKAFRDASATALNEALAKFDESAQRRFREEQERASERAGREKGEIARLLEPVQKELSDLGEMNDRLESSRVRAEGALDLKLQQIHQTSESLVNALKKPQVRGAWGEEQLRRILESAGMVEGPNYRLQHHTEEDGDALRTDVVILLPKGREVVIDSKAPLDHYSAAMNATSEEERTRSAEAHAKSVRGHFKTLKSKEYWRRYPGSPDCVFLFMPFEGAYQLACEHDKSLMADCHAQKIILANPMTLMSLVHVAAYALQEERIQGEIEQVRNVATTLGERLGKVLELLAKHRRAIDGAVTSYNEIVGSVESRLMPSMREMERLKIGNGRKLDPAVAIETNIRILPVVEGEGEQGALTLE